MALRLVLATVLFALALPSPMTAAQCVGDCRGDGEVTIDELLVLVNIALDNTPVSECESGDSNGDGTVTVNEIIAAVNKALSGCGPDVSGSWQQDRAAIASSNCAPAVTAIVQENIAAGDFNCMFQLVPSGEHVTITATCVGETDVTEGTVDATGRLTVTTSEQETMDDCPITLTQTTTGIVTTSPTVGTHNMEFRFLPVCGFADCAIAVQARWTKLASSLEVQGFSSR